MLDFSDTPKFGRPPVFETLLGVQFRALPEFRNAHYGLFWEKLRSFGFTSVEDHPALAHVLEQKEEQSKTWTWTLSLAGAPQDLGREWYLSEETSKGQSLVQLQNDKFIVNWRRRSLEEMEYPSYARNKEEFQRLYKEFLDFAESQMLGTVQIDQSEMVYINRIPFTDDCETPLAMIAKCFPMLATEGLKTFKFGVNSGANNNVSFWIDELLGRLYIEIKSVSIRATKERALDFRLTARGRPISGNNSINDMEELLTWFDKGHYFITNSFANITSPSMHTIWSRQK